MLLLNSQDVQRCLPMNQAIEVIKSAYAAFSSGQAEMPLRSRLSVGPHEATCLFMPAYVQGPGGEALGVKIVSLFPKNPERGISFIQAAVLVLEPETGCPQALLEGSSLTAIRTGAASGAATDLLARHDSRIVAIFGAGAQGRTQLDAVCSVRDIHTAWIYDPDTVKVQAFIAEVTGKVAIPYDIRLASSPEQAASQADVICTATTSLTPVFEDRWLKDGVHINGVGSYTPQMQEIPPDTVVRARVVVDSRAACLAEAGDVIKPIQAGLISHDHLQAEIGEIINHSRPGRESESQVTFFKSVGLAVQDVMAAQTVLANAAQWGVGQFIEW
jgi:ornithine cyclodeaminase/alanine dehydrogenase-like protein (mu-crystallin family)